MRFLIRLINKILFDIKEKFFKQWCNKLSIDVKAFFFNSMKLFGEVELVFQNKNYHVYFSYKEINLVKFTLVIKIFNKDSNDNNSLIMEDFEVGYPNERQLCLAIYNLIK